MSKQSKPPIDPGAITRWRSTHGQVYRVPSRSTADHTYDVLRETTGRLRCPCAAGVHDRPCCHKDAVERLEAEEAELTLEGKSLSDLADLDRAYQERQARGERLTPAEDAHWRAVMAAWLEGKYGPVAA